VNSCAQNVDTPLHQADVWATCRPGDSFLLVISFLRRCIPYLLSVFVFLLTLQKRDGRRRTIGSSGDLIVMNLRTKYLSARALQWASGSRIAQFDPIRKRDMRDCSWLSFCYKLCMKQSTRLNSNKRGKVFFTQTDMYFLNVFFATVRAISVLYK
jgi:hypothetical protein